MAQYLFFNAGRRQFSQVIEIPRLLDEEMKTLKIFFVRVIDKTWENCIHPLIWSAIAKLLSILQVRARFLEGREDGSERASRRRSVIARRGSPACRTVIRIKCRRERDFRLFVKRTSPRRCRQWTDDAGWSSWQSPWAAASRWRTRSSSPTTIPTSSSRRWVSFCGFVAIIVTYECATTDGILNVS